MTKRWYVVQVSPGFENRVVSALQARILSDGVAEFFGEILVPTEDVVEMRNGRKRKTERKIFPGYILLQMEMNDQVWYLVKGIAKVRGFLGGSSDKPAPISDAEANEVQRQIQVGAERPQPKTRFEPGEMVRVTEGPFADFNGVVEEVNYEKNRLRVAVLIFGRSTPVELEFSQVEKT